MAKEVILMETVKDLGSEGDVVTVKDGYARNYLLPRKLAAPVTEATRRRLARQRQDREAQARERVLEAQALVERLKSVSLTLPMKTSDGEHLYGSVGPVEVAAALTAQGYPVVRDQVDMPEHIRELGVFDVNIRLAAGVDAAIKLWIVEE